MYFRKRKWRLGYCVVALQISLLAAVLPLQAEITSTPETVTKEQNDFSAGGNTDGMLGKACYYNKRHNNRKTSSGALYNQGKLTAAHPNIPLGTRVKVVNLANERSVVVTVNDRCRKRNYEFIDLSYAAARELRFLGKGMARVLIIPLEE